MGKINEFLREIKITEEDLPARELKNEELSDKEPKKEGSSDKYLKEIRLPDEDLPDKEPKREGILDKFLREIKLPDEDLLKELEELDEEPEDVSVKKSSVIAVLLGILAGTILSSFLFGWN